MGNSVVVIGAGISGLSVAYEMMQRASRLPGGLDVICLEASDRPGGNIRTDSAQGFTCEWGPTGFLDNAPATLALARGLGLEDRLLPANPHADDRFIYRAGKLRRVPTTPGAFLSSKVLPLGGLLRVLGEPFVLRKRGEREESVFDFASRRIGTQAASILVDAMVSGVYAGDARQLSLQATFPKMHQMETQHGSLFRAMLAKRKTARASGERVGGPAGPGGRLTSFRGGLQELTDALARKLGDRLRLRCAVEAISDMGLRGLRVHLAEGAPLEANAVVLACPAWSAAPLVRAMDTALAEPLSEIPSAPLVVVHFGYHRGALGPVPEGFGFLVPRGQGARILGTLWISSFFEGRAPDGRLLMTTMIGGAHDPEAIGLTDEQLVRIARQDLTRVMGILAAPYFVEVLRHPQGIPQYTLGHPDRLRRIDARLAVHRGLWVAGNSYHGISVNACIEEAPRVAEKVLTHLTSR
jgi:oxygen-dependent protoporphyrinogen oxidase